MLILDVSVVNIALPAIQDDLGFSRAGLTWVVDSYVLMAGSLLLLGGRLGDVLGRRRLFLVGVAVFGVPSVACGLAREPGHPRRRPLRAGTRRGPRRAGRVRAHRAAVHRHAGAHQGDRPVRRHLRPGRHQRPDPVGRARRVRLLALDLPAQHPGRRRRPGARPAARRHGRAPSCRRARALDVRGAVLVTDRPHRGRLRPHRGRDRAVVVGAGARAAARRARRRRRSSSSSQTRVRTPLLPLRFLQERTRVSANLVTLLFFSVFFSQFFITTLYLQDVLGFSALRTGLGFLPFGVAVGAALGARHEPDPAGRLPAGARRRPAAEPRRRPAVHQDHRRRLVPHPGAARLRRASPSAPGCACRRSATPPSTASPRTTPAWRRACSRRCSRSAAPSAWRCS